MKLLKDTRLIWEFAPSDGYEIEVNTEERMLFAFGKYEAQPSDHPMQIYESYFFTSKHSFLVTVDKIRESFEVFEFSTVSEMIDADKMVAEIRLQSSVQKLHISVTNGERGIGGFVSLKTYWLQGQNPDFL